MAFLIQSAMSCITSGDIVSSIWAYSVGRPVVQCWKRWFSSGYSFMRLRLFGGNRRRMAVRLPAAATWVSLLPLMAITGHFTERMSADGS